jgi:hypothetical protein
MLFIAARPDIQLVPSGDPMVLSNQPSIAFVE